MRVAYLGHTARHPIHGVGHSTLALAEALAWQRGEDELVIFRSREAVWKDRSFPAAEGAVRFIDLPAIIGRRRVARIFWEQVILPCKLRSRQFDLVHSPSYTLPLCAQLPGVVTVHDILALTRPNLCKSETRVHYGLLLPRSIRGASRIIVPSQSVKQQVNERLGVGVDRIRVIFPGIRESFRDQVSDDDAQHVRLRYRLPETFILAPGNLEPKKNLDRLIGAFHAARRAGLCGELLLIGGPGWGGGRSGSFGMSVRWLGYVPDRDADVLYRQAAEMAYPSLAEGFGLPVIEALASGTVVVASEVPAVQEVGRDAVVVVDPLSVSSIAEGLLKARQDTGLRRILKDRGIERSLRFSWEQAARETWEVYREVVAP